MACFNTPKCYVDREKASLEFLMTWRKCLTKFGWVLSTVQATPGIAIYKPCISKPVLEGELSQVLPHSDVIGVSITEQKTAKTCNLFVLYDNQKSQNLDVARYCFGLYANSKNHLRDINASIEKVGNGSRPTKNA